MSLLEIIEAFKNHPEDLKETLKLTTERCLYASKEAFYALN